MPTESALPDFWGGDRQARISLPIACSLWTQTRASGCGTINSSITICSTRICRHPPVLLTVKQKGMTIDAVAQGTKNGLLFVFDRVSGEPLWPIHELPVAQSELPRRAHLAHSTLSD